jgi:hypothetical protein
VGQAARDLIARPVQSWAAGRAAWAVAAQGAWRVADSAP